VISRQRFDLRKAIESILYVAQRNSDTYTILKILYFADKKHFARYGRSIYGDIYVAMRHGPVPSGAYDIIKYIRGDGGFYRPELGEKPFEVEDNDILPLRPANTAFLSESEIECLDDAIEQYGSLSFKELRGLSHSDPAYMESDENDIIPVEKIVENLPNGEVLLDYLRGA